VAGYLKGNNVEHDWSALQSTSETLVFYMGLLGLPEICKQLQAHGRAPDTPVALVERGTKLEQRVLVGTLDTMVDIVAREQPSAPTIIIVGDVVRLHGELSWFGERT
jgi:uroporphyrin-III C-methyltransferase/precorrin-2 dehydrogenase/sirohydrochlorin ferrochelatase